MESTPSVANQTLEHVNCTLKAQHTMLLTHANPQLEHMNCKLQDKKHTTHYEFAVIPAHVLEVFAFFLLLTHIHTEICTFLYCTQKLSMLQHCQNLSCVQHSRITSSNAASVRASLQSLSCAHHSSITTSNAASVGAALQMPVMCPPQQNHHHQCSK